MIKLFHQNQAPAAQAEPVRRWNTKIKVNPTQRESRTIWATLYNATYSLSPRAFVKIFLTVLLIVS